MATAECKFAILTFRDCGCFDTRSIVLFHPFNELVYSLCRSIHPSCTNVELSPFPGVRTSTSLAFSGFKNGYTNLDERRIAMGHEKDSAQAAAPQHENPWSESLN